MQYTGQPADADTTEAAAAATAVTAAAAAAVEGSSEVGVSGSSPSAGALLSCVKQQLFESAAFARLLKAMLGVEILKHAGEVRRFRAGKDTL